MERIQRKRSKGWTMPDNTKYVGRGSKWGNPYKVADCQSITECLTLYKEHLRKQLQAGSLNLSELQGKNLACWCPVGSPCHADILLQAVIDGKLH